ncbi:MAG: FecR family protein [Candidatus Sericytochromatia bacterium]
MQAKLATFALALICASLTLTAPAPAASTARVAWTYNTVQITRGGRWVTAGNGSSVASGGYVRTGTNSRAQIHYADGTVMRLGSRSVVRVRDARAKSVQVHRGKAYFKVKPQQQRMRVRTRTAVATVLGTEFVVSVDEMSNQQSHLFQSPVLSYGTAPTQLAQNQDTWVTEIVTISGLVGVSGLDGQNPIDLGPGMGTLIGNNLPPQQPTAVDLNEFKQEEELLHNEQPGDDFANRPLDPGNPQQQITVQQNTPGGQGALNTSPTTGSLEVIIK